MKKYKFLIVLFPVLLVAGCLDSNIEDPSQRLNADILAIDNYLSLNGIDAIEDLSGIRIVIHTLGNGPITPSLANQVKVIYEGRLFSNGEVFDEGTANGLLTGFINGWQIAIPMLPQGTIATLYIPSYWGYGSSKTGSIPPNSILVFEVELENIIRSQTQIDRFKTDTTAIETYLADHNITEYVKDPTGIRYVIEEEGTGIIPSWYDKVKFDHVGKIMSTGTTFSEGTYEPSSQFDSRVVNFTSRGLQLGLQKIGEQGKITIYIPSYLGFGDQAVGTIPQSSNLIYEVDLLQVSPE